MKLKILSLAKTEKETINLPEQFKEPVRPDIINRAVLAVYANKRQPYGTDPEAGKKSHSKLSRRRQDYKGSYGHGISRVPRKIISRSGTQFNWVGAFSPGTVGGRRAQPPKAEKIWKQKINKKERRKAIRSAMAATLVKDLAKARGHDVPDNYPFIIESKIEAISKTKDLANALEKLGFTRELSRAGRKIRAGKGKSRGRKYKKTRGMLIVTSDDCNLMKAAGNITGVEVENIRNLNAEILAPGAIPGRMTIFTDSAIALLEKEKLFADDYKGEKEEKIEKKEIPKEKPVKKETKKPAAKKVAKK
jgi:large subunit ribosomal protein L4e